MRVQIQTDSLLSTLGAPSGQGTGAKSAGLDFPSFFRAATAQDALTSTALSAEHLLASPLADSTGPEQSAPNTGLFNLAAKGQSPLTLGEAPPGATNLGTIMEKTLTPVEGGLEVVQSELDSPVAPMVPAANLALTTVPEAGAMVLSDVHPQTGTPSDTGEKTADALMAPPIVAVQTSAKTLDPIANEQTARPEHAIEGADEITPTLPAQDGDVVLAAPDAPQQDAITADLAGVDARDVDPADPDFAPLPTELTPDAPPLSSQPVTPIAAAITGATTAPRAVSRPAPQTDALPQTSRPLDVGQPATQPLTDTEITGDTDVFDRLLQASGAATSRSDPPPKLSDALAPNLGQSADITGAATAPMDTLATGAAPASAPISTASTTTSAASVQTAAPPPLDMSQSNWAETLVASIERPEGTADGDSLTLTLTPERLGTLQIRLEQRDGLTHVHIITATPEAAKIMSEAQHRLADLMTRAGLEMGNQSTSSDLAQNAQQNDTGNGWSQSGAGRSDGPLGYLAEPDPLAATPPPTTAAPLAHAVDLMA